MRYAPVPEISQPILKFFVGVSGSENGVCKPDVTEERPMTPNRTERRPLPTLPAGLHCPYCLWLLVGVVSVLAWPGLLAAESLAGPVWLWLIALPFGSALLKRGL